MHKNFTEQLMSNTVLDFPRALEFEPWTLAPRACAALFEYMQSVRVFENITCCSLFTNRLRPFRDFNHHTVTSNNHPFLFSSETCNAVLSSLSLPVLVMISASFSDSFKYFHTADMFAALEFASIWSCHVIVRYNIFTLFAYNFGCRTFGASLMQIFFIKCDCNIFFVCNLRAQI